jgi:hypothetical protein
VRKLDHARVGRAYAASLIVALLVVLAPMACGPRRAPTVADSEPVTPAGQPLTAEEVIRESDLHRLVGLDDISAQAQFEEDMRYLDGHGDPDVIPAAESKTTLEHIGRATWSVLTIAFTLGMAALPFLI